jgi:hypothetical protein
MKTRVRTTPVAVIRRSSTKDTGPPAFARYPANSMSPQCRPRLLMNCCVFTLCVVRKKSGSNWNFLQPQVASGFSVITGIWSPMEVEKNVCQRLGDQVSSLRWDLIWPNQLMGLKPRRGYAWGHPQASWDSRPVISVRSTESSTVATMRWYLLGDPMLWGDGSNVNLGVRALIPHKGSLNESVELWDGEGNSLILLRDT